VVTGRQDWVRTGVLITGAGFALWVMLVHLTVVTFCAAPVRYMSAALFATAAGAVAAGLEMPAPLCVYVAGAGFASHLAIRAERYL